MDAPFLQEARLLRTLAHPGRLAILASLRKGPACVCHLAVVLGHSQAYLSQQLTILKDAGVIEAYRDGAFTFHQLRDYGILGLVELTSRLLGNTTTAMPRASATLKGCGCPRCAEAVTTASGAPQ